MKWFKEHRVAINIVIMVLFLFVCIGTTSQGRAYTTAPEGIIRNTTSPVERVLYLSSQYVKNLYDFVVDLPFLKAKNEQLEKELNEAEIKLANYDKLTQENEELLKLLDFTKENSQYQYISASVVSVDPYRGFSLVVINKGSNEGVKKDMTVILSEGLVGRVKEVSNGTSKVLTIIDSTSMFNGISVKSKDYIRITGKDDQSMLKGYADPEAKIKKGDIIVTSGLAGVFEKNIVVGKVKEIKADAGRLEKILTIEPSIDIEKIDKVLLIKR
ncbi:rod shape-determining protein MreC [Alkalibaculum bacchi]|uniref:rod shape-determining protein MreC n=1 Tax=Alkalibaculum bacchi TaxID=645887 RepID=UPI0026EA9ADB|nr:rod shape-determining protein MreC [Alkalibaculum bacchi]